MTIKKWTIHEVTQYFHTFGLKCDSRTVLDWISDGQLVAQDEEKGLMIQEEHIYEFLYNYRWEGTAYEQGIDDQTKIKRLEEVIRELKEENNRLRDELLNLERILGISLFD